MQSSDTRARLLNTNLAGEKGNNPSKLDERQNHQQTRTHTQKICLTVLCIFSLSIVEYIIRELIAGPARPTPPKVAC